jgi:DNA-binding GntR family transcriptional regulator
MMDSPALLASFPQPGVTSRIRERVEAQVREMVVDGRLAPGAKLNERILAERLGASRTPLREAMLQLEREGLVRSDLRRGFTVEPLSAQEVRDTYPMIARLECLAVEESVALLPALVPALERINAAFGRARAPRRALALDTEFHDTLMSGSTNRRLSTLMAVLRRAIGRYEHVYMSDRSLTSVSVGHHEAVIAAIRAGDLAGALAAIERNYAFGMQSLLGKMSRF